MTNYEHYKEQIEKFARLNACFALDNETRKIVLCAGLECSKCEFNRSASEYTCEIKKLTWADAEYIDEPEVDWSKVAVDTPVLVSNDGTNWVRRYFAVAVETETIYVVYAGGATRWSSDGLMEQYKYAKLAEVK